MVTLRRFVPFVAIAALGVAACQPVKKAPPGSTTAPPGSFITHYLTGDSDSGGDTFRSVEPHSRALVDGGTSAQLLQPDGSVVLGVANAGNDIINGFVTTPFRLGDIQTIQVQLAADCCGGVTTSLLFDVDGDGEFLRWAADGVFLDAGGDIIGERDRTMRQLLTITDFTHLEMSEGSGQLRTLASVKAGAEPGINANTKVAIFVSLTVDGVSIPSGLAVVTALRVNGVDLLVP